MPATLDKPIHSESRLAGLCECGCGRRTNLARQTRREFGWVKGEPLRFVRGHSARVQWNTSTEPYRVDPDTGCWVWRRAKSDRGYAQIRGSSGTMVYAHRVYFERARGP